MYVYKDEHTYISVVRVCEMEREGEIECSGKEEVSLNSG